MLSWLLSLFLTVHFANGSYFMVSGHGVEFAEYLTDRDQDMVKLVLKSAYHGHNLKAYVAKKEQLGYQDPTPPKKWPHDLVTVKFFGPRFLPILDSLGVKFNEAFESGSIELLDRIVFKEQTIESGTPYDEHYFTYGKEFQLVSGVYHLDGREFQQILSFPHVELTSDLTWISLDDMADYITKNFKTEGRHVIYWNACRSYIPQRIGVDPSTGHLGSFERHALTPLWDSRAIHRHRSTKMHEYSKIIEARRPFIMKWADFAVDELQNELYKEERAEAERRRSASTHSHESEELVFAEGHESEELSGGLPEFAGLLGEDSDALPELAGAGLPGLAGAGLPGLAGAELPALGLLGVPSIAKEVKIQQEMRAIYEKYHKELPLTPYIVQQEARTQKSNLEGLRSHILGSKYLSAKFKAEFQTAYGEHIKHLTAATADLASASGAKQEYSNLITSGAAGHKSHKTLKKMANSHPLIHHDYLNNGGYDGYGGYDDLNDHSYLSLFIIFIIVGSFLLCLCYIISCVISFFSGYKVGGMKKLNKTNEYDIEQEFA